MEIANAKSLSTPVDVIAAATVTPNPLMGVLPLVTSPLATAFALRKSIFGGVGGSAENAQWQSNDVLSAQLQQWDRRGNDEDDTVADAVAALVIN